ncbi:MAG: hypothetical protein J6M02_02730 [Clostridia bacterium]|nr:hypothetical protein [Clostridia bacterium]
MKNTDLLDQLESTYAYLKEDITALSYLQEEYFISTTPFENLEDVYFKIQNILEILIKAMKLNELQLKEYIHNLYNTNK